MANKIQKITGSDVDGMSVPDWDDIPEDDDAEPEDANASHGDE